MIELVDSYGLLFRHPHTYSHALAIIITRAPQVDYDGLIGGMPCALSYLAPTDTTTHHHHHHIFSRTSILTSPQVDYDGQHYTLFYHLILLSALSAPTVESQRSALLYTL